jgi:CheY-like chemotaxis protein
LAESIAEGLGFGGHNVRVAPNGAEAVKRFEEIEVRSELRRCPPVMNGVGVLALLQSRSAWRK